MKILQSITRIGIMGGIAAFVVLLMAPAASAVSVDDEAATEVVGVTALCKGSEGFVIGEVLFSNGLDVVRSISVANKSAQAGPNEQVSFSVSLSNDDISAGEVLVQIETVPAGAATAYWVPISTYECETEERPTTPLAQEAPGPPMEELAHTGSELWFGLLGALMIIAGACILRWHSNKNWEYQFKAGA